MTNNLLNEDLCGLLREARDNAIASTAEEDISGDRRAYRRELAERLNSARASLAKPQPVDRALENAAEQFIAWHKDGAPKAAMLDYFAEIFGEALATPIAAQPAAAERSDDWYFSEVIRAGNDGYAQGLIDGKALAAPAQAAAVPEAVARDAARYQLLRRGQQWSVIDGIGDALRGEVLDAALDRVSGEGEGA